MDWQTHMGMANHLKAELPLGILPHGSTQAMIIPAVGARHPLDRRYRVLCIWGKQRGANLFGGQMFTTVEEAQQAVEEYARLQAA